MAIPYETLKKRSQFVRIARKGERCFSSVCSIQFLKKKEASGVRIGFTATKRLGNAVHRNRAKRRMRALVLDLLNQHSLTKGDYVLIAQKDMLDLSYKEIGQRMSHSFLKKRWAYPVTDKSSGVDPKSS